MTSRARASAALVLTTLALAAGCGGGGDGGGTTKTTTSTTAVRSGEQIFATVGCATCHVLAAAGAGGKVGPDLDDLKPSEALVVKQVTHGGGGMPAFDGQLSEAEIQAVARYVSSVAGGR